MSIIERFLTKDRNGFLKKHVNKAQHDTQLLEKARPVTVLEYEMDNMWRQARRSMDIDYTDPTQPILWATDGSMTPAPRLEPRATAVGLTGPTFYSARLQDTHASVLDAEITALAIALQIDMRHRESYRFPASTKSVIFVDNLNTVNRANDAMKEPDFRIGPSASSRHVTRWLRDLLRGKKHLDIIHQKAHTDDTSKGAVLNREADEQAKEGLTADFTHYFPLEYFDEYPLLTKDLGITHAHVPTIVGAIWQSRHTSGIFSAPGCYDFVEHRLFSTATSAYGALTQLLIRSHQLPTPHLNNARQLQARNRCPTCYLCSSPASDADPRHIFVLCSGTSRHRNNLLESLTQITDRHFDHNGFERDEHYHAMIDFAGKVTRDSDLWEDGQTHFWEGLLPPKTAFDYDPRHKWLFQKYTSAIIRTTGHIWATYEKAAPRQYNPNR